MTQCDFLIKKKSGLLEVSVGFVQKPSGSNFGGEEGWIMT